MEKLRGLGLLPNFCLLMNHVSVASFSENAPKRKTHIYVYIHTCNIDTGRLRQKMKSEKHALPHCLALATTTLDTWESDFISVNPYQLTPTVPVFCVYIVFLNCIRDLIYPYILYSKYI